MASPEPALSLYVHVPFCTDKCLYCDFFSVPRSSISSAVLRRVVEQSIELARVLLEACGAPVQTLFIGGGTPSCLPPPLRRTLLRSFQRLGLAEWTVESNPETLSESFLDDCAAAGVTRLSVGIQSLSSPLLATLERRATREHARAAIRLLRARWKRGVNLDFITGIPGQTPADVGEDLAVIDGAWPDHVSLYQLTVEPGTPLEARAREGSIILNAEEVDEELWLAGRDHLLSRGYRQYEVSNFSLPGKECLHNLRYWRMEPYAGAGPGAVSTLPAGWAARASCRPELGERAAVVRLSAPRDIAAFLRGRDGFWGIEPELVGPADFLLECLMMGLRLSEGMPQRKIQEVFGNSFQELFPGIWERWVSRGYALAASEALQLSPAGLLILDHLLGEIMEALPRERMKEARISWPWAPEDGLP